MTLGKIVENYLQQNEISQRSFAKKCGLSAGYISMLVNGVNPRSNTPIVPTLTSLHDIAKGMGITIDELLSLMDDSTVELDFNKSSNTEEFTRLFAQLSEEQQKLIIASIRGILENK